MQYLQVASLLLHCKLQVIKNWMVAKAWEQGMRKITNQSFIQRERGGGPGIPPPLPEILKLSMVIVVLSQVLKTEILSQIASEAI